MSIAILFNQKDAIPWKQALTELLPEVDITIGIPQSHPETIKMALCWKPDQGICDNLPALQVVHSAGAAVDHILDTQQLSPNVSVCRIVDDALSQHMFEYVLAGILNFNRHISSYATKSTWEPEPYRTIESTQVTVLGLGAIGSVVAQKLSQIGFKLKGWSRTKKELNNIQCFTGKNGLLEVCKDSNVLINLLPHTSETKGLIDNAVFQTLKPNALFINAGRGETLREHDLIKALDKQFLSQALLDVFTVEPLPDEHIFFKREDIIVTPHTASITSVQSASKIIADNYSRMLADAQLLHLANK